MQNLIPGEASSRPAHSKIGASSMKRWQNCPGSVRLCEGVEQVSSPYAAEGTLAHELAEKMLTHKAISGVYPEGMLEAVRVYVDFIASRTHAKTDVLIEHRFDLSQLHPGLFGTADCVIFDRATKKLIVVDYKHGAGVAVDAKENSQLLYYGLGAALTLDFKPKTVELVVVQPRCFHPAGPIRSWEMEAIELASFAATLVEAAKATEDPNAPLKSGPHCQFCPAAGFCPELHREATALAQVDFSPVAGADPEKLALVLQSIPKIEKWIKAVRDYADAEAKAGRVPPGFELVDKRAVRQWGNEAETVKALRGWGLKDEDIFEESLRSPAQMEKRIKGKDAQERIIGPLVIWKSSGQTLAPIGPNGPKPGVVSAQKDFEALE